MRGRRSNFFQLCRSPTFLNGIALIENLSLENYKEVVSEASMHQQSQEATHTSSKAGDRWIVVVTPITVISDNIHNLLPAFTEDLDEANSGKWAGEYIERPSVAACGKLHVVGCKRRRHPRFWWS